MAIKPAWVMFGGDLPKKGPLSTFDMFLSR